MKFIKTCESIFNEIQQLRRDLIAGKIAPDTYALQMGGIAQLEKQQKLMLSGFIAEKRLKVKLPVNLNSGALKIEEEHLFCPDQDTAITRSGCLSYSGEKAHNKFCTTCGNYKTTRDLLIPKKE